MDALRTHCPVRWCFAPLLLAVLSTDLVLAETLQFQISAGEHHATTQPAVADEQPTVALATAIEDVTLCDDCSQQPCACSAEVVVGEAIVEEVAELTLEPWLPKRAYRWSEHETTLVTANQENLAWLGLGTSPYLGQADSQGLTTGYSIHFLDGPLATDLPPRLFDFSAGLQFRNDLGPWVSYDVATTIGVFSDFEDSARDGVRLPSHAVGFLHVTPQTDWVLGVDYLDRDDLKLLPVVGFAHRWADTVLIDCVFPRPRLVVRVADKQWLRLSARLGGGSWDIERPDESDDVFTYRDYQLLIGLDNVSDDGDNYASVELGWLFQRRLAFRSSPTQLDLDDAFMIRFSTSY